MLKRRAQLLQEVFYRFRVPLTILGWVIVLGTLGYFILWWHEEATLLDAFYMTLITVTTIGFAEIYPLGTAGRILTIVVALAGISSLFYLFTAVMEFLVTYRLTHAKEMNLMQSKIDKLDNHLILAGFGRMGRRTAAELAEDGKPFVIIDEDEAVLEDAQHAGYLMIVGDASEDDVLLAAGIKRAEGLIATTGHDANNAFIVMTGRALNSKLRIIARAESDASVRKLIKAGANRVLDPYALGGKRLANLFLRPAAVDFLETHIRRGKLKLDIADYILVKGSPFIGKTLLELDLRRRYGVNVLAILRDGEPVSNLENPFCLAVGDQLIALGTQEQLGKLAHQIRLDGH